jgi:hypothetical protein
MSKRKYYLKLSKEDKVIFFSMLGGVVIWAITSYFIYLVMNGAI